MPQKPILEGMVPLPLTGIDGQPKTVLTSTEGSTVEVYLHGAHVTSWRPAGMGEQLFLSGKSAFGDGAAIRGGVPVIFPQFSLLGPLPRHGFVRNHAWEMVRQTGDEATFVHTDNDKTREIWPHGFRAAFSVRVESHRLEMELRIVNTGGTVFDFSSALHTYLRVSDVHTATVEGLQGLTFRDANTMVEHLESPRCIEFGQEVDRLYYDVGERPLTLRDGEREIIVTAEGFPDAVVWNPGKAKSDNLGDMEPDGWLRFVCIEAAAAHERVGLSPGEEWRGRQVLTLAHA